MHNFLRAYINRATLVKIRNILISLYQTLTTSQNSNDQQPQQPPPFDPMKPSTPISYPLKTLEELESRSYFHSFHFPFNKAKVKLQSDSVNLPNRPRILVCHDMQGGYVDDKWVQGSDNADAYVISHWYLMDVFVYFSHYLVTIPPPCWVNTAHRHGVKVLGTFITEWNEGRVMCNKLLSSKESAQMYAECLAELAVALGFDGWLINMEVNLDLNQIPILKEFVSHLTPTMHSSMPGSLVIWYDSITVDGKLAWQNQLNEKNRTFFDLCDGLFVNYTWKENYPRLSAAGAGDRKFDVYMGIDVFGRNTYGGGQWTTYVALDEIKKSDVSAAIFAPAWVYETQQPPNFKTAQNRWWALVKKSWGTLQNYPIALPFHSNFDQGHGHYFYIEGEQVKAGPWCNISCQGFQPLLEYTKDPPPGGIEVNVNVNGPSYSGGGNITFRGTLEGNSYFTARLFKGNLLLGNSRLLIVYSVQSEGKSRVALCLNLSSEINGSKSILLAPQEPTLPAVNQFYEKFDRVITPSRVSKPGTTPGWVIQESSIEMNGYTLTEVNAVCYFTYTELSESALLSRSHSPDKSTSQSQFYALLGHITINTPEQRSVFPPSTSWLVEHRHVNWSSSSDGLRTLSLCILWKMENENDLPFARYYIFVEKIGKQAAEHSNDVQECAKEYLGVAEVETFYVSELAVPAGISVLRFIIQVCSVDGVCQKLDDSPYFQLDVEHQ